MLDTVMIPELAGHVAPFSGIDHPSHCLDSKHFHAYPGTIEYCYNSRGFRDQEWPQDVTDAVWCLGDSFTSGIGSQLQHTWVWRLGTASQRRTINISMDGASNEWIARRCCDIYSELQPANIVIMWSYPHRRERAGSGSDLERRIYHIKSTVQEDYENFQQCRQQVQTHCSNSRIVELVIPNWQPALTESGWQKIRDATWPQHAKHINLEHAHIIKELVELHGIDKDLLLQQLQHYHSVLNNLIEVPQLDTARDGHHFDCVTADWVAAQVLARLR
jgi:hypothetical protein